ncbi:MAG: GNAT family N-acetyltransferase [Actinomycetota bacterium]|nr:GNAT family N-acetyltransferase [Actinomycetota bacterium]
MEIREARPEEYEEVAALTVAAYLGLPGAHLSGGYEGRLRDVAARAAAAVVFVAVESGSIVGAVTYVPGPHSPWAELLDEGEAGVRMLAVPPAAQRQGVGTALVRACIEQARREGRHRVCLHTTPWMAAARRIYERLGFRRDPRRDWVPVPGVPLLGFVLDLEP